MAFENNDELLVNRSGTTYTVNQENLMAEIQSNDLLLVNRSGTTYTATGQELIDSVVPDLTLAVSFIPNVAYVDNVVTAVGNTSGGVEPTGGYTFTYQWHLSDNVTGANQENIVGANTSEYTPLEAQIGLFLGCTIQTTDDRGTIANATSRLGPIAYRPPEAPPFISALELVQDQINDKRFAGNSFTTTVTATENPTSLQLEAEVVGALSLEVSTDRITAEDTDGDTPLALTLNSDLNLLDGRFEVGDQVKASASYTPTSNTIISTAINSQASPEGQIFTGPVGNATTGVELQSYFDAAGVTSISGIALKYVEGLSAAIYDIRANGLSLQTVISNVKEYGSAFSPVTNWASGGYVQTNTPNENTGGWYYFTFDPFTTTAGTTLAIQDYSNSQYSVQVLAQDGLWYTLINDNVTPPESTNLTLTLASDKDLNKFQAGDIIQGATTAFTATTYEGTGSIGQSVSTGIDNTAKSLVWIKQRNGSQSYQLTDSARGATKTVSTDLTSGETNGNNLQSLTADGFTLLNSYGSNEPGMNYIAWNFSAQPGFFDVISYTGNSVAGRQLSHSLGSAPGFVMLKRTSSQGGRWWCWHKDFANAETFLNMDRDELDTATRIFNSTLPSSQYITIGDEPEVNGNGDSCVAYVFADTPGLIKCGSYSGPLGASASVDVGFKPQWIMVRSKGGSGDWAIYDNKRSVGNTDKVIAANRNNAETPLANNKFLTFTDTGWTWNDFGVSDINYGNGAGDYVYIAIAEAGPPAVSVIDTDVASNTITVDGGKWDASNQSEVWSEAQSGNWSNARYMFDGDLTSIGYGDKGQVNLPSLTAQSSIEVYFYTGDMSTAGGAADQWEVNNVNISALHPNPGGPTDKLQWVDVSSAFTFPVGVSRIRTAGNNQGGVAAIKVDGLVLVNAVIDSQVWTSQWTGDVFAGYPVSNMFDGDLDTQGATSC